MRCTSAFQSQALAGRRLSMPSWRPKAASGSETVALGQGSRLTLWPEPHSAFARCLSATRKHPRRCEPFPRSGRHRRPSMHSGT
ncbi:Transcriptional regulator MraZ [Frankliniella fusca]|uniref:Transcriptional regulator MraZ n=1 Tax=Frankliniella fusca TaxID=407009 RepID=A0AAE1I002_9NEOP|nr:Transcriptional regulator MraZ [Frankliniella fusca]